MGHCREPHSTRKPRFEMLESRLLLSGAPVPWAPTGPPGGILRLDAALRPPLVTDLAGPARLCGPAVDMGAYGFAGPVDGGIRGSKFHDLDGDGQWDDGEPGLEGWTVYVDADQDGELGADERSAVTDPEGNYALTGLPPGTYTVAEVPLDGWEQTHPADTERVSLAGDGAQGDGRSFRPSISADGRYVAFTSEIASLVPGDTNGRWDIFVRDRQTGAVERVNLASDGSQADGWSQDASISADGRYVAFMSGAVNLVPGDQDIDDNEDVFVYDRQTRTIECASLSLSGVPANHHNRYPSISADGRFVAFQSHANTLVPDDTNGKTDTFVYDRQTGELERVSVSSDGTQANNHSEMWPAISADGRYVAFLSAASNLVPGDTNDRNDVFVYDRSSGTIERVSMAPDGAQANNHSDEPWISADGRYVAFCSYASNLAAADDNYYADTFIYDRQTASLQWVSRPPDGSATDNNSYPGGFSADGRFLAFASFASDLIPGDSGNTGDVFVYDQTGQTFRRVGTAADGTPGNDHSYYPAISADGRFLAFESDASNLVEGDTNDSKDIFVCTNTLAGARTHRVVLDGDQVVEDIDFGNRQLLGEIRGGKFHDLDGDGQWDDGEPGLGGWTIYLDADQDGQLDADEPFAVTNAEGDYALTSLPSGTYTVSELPQYGWQQTFPSYGDIERVNLAADGSQADDRSFHSAFSADGRYVAFRSGAANLVPDDTNGKEDLFLVDRQAGAIERVSVASDGSQPNGDSDWPTLSANGRFVAFESDANNLVPGGNDFGNDIFVFDRQTEAVECVSRGINGSEGGGYRPAISANGRFVTFTSRDTNLVPGDTNGEPDIFVHDRETGTTERVSLASDGSQADGFSRIPKISTDGRFVTFYSGATNLVPDDTNGESDVFVYDRETDTIERVSLASDGSQGDGDSLSSSISADGRYVTFLSRASNLVAEDTNGAFDIFLHDRQTATTRRVSVASDGSEANGESHVGVVSGDGRYVTFYSHGSNLVPGDTNDCPDVFVHDCLAGATRRLSMAFDGSEADEISHQPTISADGRYVAFQSHASNLVPDDTNGALDVFVVSIMAAGRPGSHVVSLDAGQIVEDMDFGNGRTDTPLIVSTTVDEIDGEYGLGDLSLREALALAAGLPGDDVIEFHDSLIGGTILLDAALGELAIHSHVEVLGPGADRLTVDAGGNSRVFRVGSEASAVIAGLTITGGWAEDANGGADAAGGGICNFGVLTLEGVLLTGSYAGGGGGVCNFAAATLAGVTVSGNSAREGGGIANYEPGVMTVTASTIAGNLGGGGIRNEADLTLTGVTVADNAGGGITNEGPLAIADSTISGNTTDGAGGGIQNYQFPLTLTNSTISGNSSQYHGGGLYVNGGAARLVNVTVADNRALEDGGGIFRYDHHGAVVTLHNTIVAGNVRGAQGERSEVVGALDDASSHNLIGSAGGPAGLGPLADNGGPTLTHALLPHSAALDAGSNSRAQDAGLTHDQRGFDRFVDADGDGDAIVDVGAYESDVLPPPVRVLHVPGPHDFDGEADVLEFEDRPALDITEYTVALWFQADDPTGGAQTLIARGEDWAHDKAQWVVELNDRVHPGKLQLWYEQANDRDHYFPTSTTIEPGQWYHVAVTRSGAGEVTVYLNGEVELRTTDPVAPASVETPVTVGARRNSPGRMQDYFDGTMHEVHVYRGVLDDQAIQDLLEETRPECWSSDPIPVSDAGLWPDVAMHGDGGFVVAWSEPDVDSEGIFAQRYRADGTALGGRIAVNATTAGAQQDAAVAARPDGGFVVVWASEQAGTQAILARLFDAHGTPIGGELPVGEHGDSSWGRPDVSVDGQGGFVVVWNGYWNADGVLARRFDRHGTPLSPPFQVDTEAHTSYGWPQVAVNEGGWFVVASPRGEWITTTLVTCDPGGELVSTSELDSHYRPGLAIDDDGLFVVSWIGDYPDQPGGDLYALYAQLYSVAGTEVGPRVMVTPGKAGGLDWNIYDCDVAMDDGSFVVVWKDYEYDPAGYHGNGIYAARYDMEGNLLGEEIVVGELGVQEYNPAVAAGDDGRFAAAWQVRWGDGIVARAFRCSPPAVEPPGELLHLAGELAFEGGEDDYLTVDEPALNTNVYTLALWLKADDPAGGTQSLLARGEDWSGDKAQWVVELNDPANPGKLQLWYEGADDRDAVFATAGDIQAGDWYHFAATRSADGQVNIYLNGVLERSTTSSIVPASIDAPVLVGARTNTPHAVQDFYDGALAEVFVYDRPLSAYEVNSLLLATMPGEPRELVYDHPGAIKLNGTDEYVAIDEAALDLTEYTIAFRFRADDPNRGTQSLIARGEDWSSDKAQWVVELNDRQNRGKLQLWYEDDGDGDHYFAAAATIEADTWYHAAFTRSADGMVRVYLNGQQVVEKLDAASPATVDTPVLIGARMNQPGRVQDYFDGTIEGVQVYNYAMSARQVVEVVPPPRLELVEPVDGQAFPHGEVNLSLRMDRPLTELSYRLDGADPVSLIGPNWVYQEDPDAAIVRSLGSGAVEFGYLKPEWAVGARWQYEYSTADGTFRVVKDLPQDAWDHDADRVAVRVIYRDSTTAPVRTQYGEGIWRDWHELGPNNPGGSGDDAGALHDGIWSTGAAYHNGARRWLTSVAGTYVKFHEEAIWWDVQLVQDAVQRTIDAAPGTHTLSICGTDTMGKTASVAVTFTVEWADDLNGDFETGTLGPWVLTDSGAVVTADLFTPHIPPAGGSYMGYITTGRNELPSDLHFTDLDGNGVAEREYSALAVEISTPGAAVVEVDLNFLTAEILPGGSFGASDLLGVTTGSITDTDAYELLFAVAPLDGSYAGTASPLTAADFSDEYIQDNPFGAYPTIADRSVFYGRTGFHRYSFPLAAGTHTLTFFVADSHTDGEATAMLIDDLTVTLV